MRISNLQFFELVLVSSLEIKLNLNTVLCIN